MRAALALAARGLGNTWPNPSVGCVIVRDGRVVGRGHTRPGGRPHAETEALRAAAGRTEGATAYVTLEPCCHWGRTPPCTDALIAARVARVVVALRDPDPRVDGEGLQRLRDAGIVVEIGLLEDEARRVNAGFVRRLEHGLPLVTLKLATTLDGRIATRTGESQWITGPEARRMAHALRGCHDAVMAGSGTLLADDPELTCRLPGFAPRPTVRVIADARLRTPLGARLFNAEAPAWIATRPGHDPAALAALEQRGAEFVDVPPATGGGLEPEALLRALAAKGISRLLVEGGAILSASLLRAGLVNRVAWFMAPSLIGGDGLPGFDSLGVDRLEQMPRLRVTSRRPAGDAWLVEADVIASPGPPNAAPG
ncbi:bifunctional diaminohydroxyphosphoribosylaminopyrimidine deaminase/5-amino-6-(5-phosphoribosylamino)uracil reductase RibD [Roseomonas sp. SSH11]|uniref:Riboflavin biosynthesis protein RibD n=1 Tax=Pararoseomonas baculiformis TaxID=2820812 RepID=A0ABS4AGY0_9PROT|nr:bifunctional diaminohydroxyphosphoribosylaminopyrimidine deaminase/5-amino-6-(5-phosphoribosylamino)uracil reductase RibD [Pararoseomonas baculiformis]MBP0445780.1 bifunctional diaminohydroxyphosphoribosylaminopyrimidine deaminase/5-amino-6-(5-phosphoribosylamino)uracil reductase RibD [Pararoseomonas baculiformis]